MRYYPIRDNKKSTAFFLSILSLAVLFFMTACVATPPPEKVAAKFMAEQTRGAVETNVRAEKPAAVYQLPARYQKPSYVLDTTNTILDQTHRIVIPVGARITPAPPNRCVSSCRSWPNLNP